MFGKNSIALLLLPNRNAYDCPVGMIGAALAQVGLRAARGTASIRHAVAMPSPIRSIVAADAERRNSDPGAFLWYYVWMKG